jgi:uncharacterized protein (TIGR02302 family)
VTDRPADAQDERLGRDDATATLLAQALRRARWTILWERLWPALAAVATAVGVFLVLSWLGVWLWLPPIARAIGLIVCLVLIAATAVPLFYVRFPSRAQALHRLDRLSGMVHRPATAMADQLATPVDDPLSHALWRAHVLRAIAAARALKTGIPAPRLPLRDPYALRAAVLVLAVATFFGAGGERWSRITAAFDWQGVVAPKNFRVDAWVTPPPYTARPPVLLPGVRPGEPTRMASSEPLLVPVGSTLVVRATGAVQVDLATKGGLKPAEQTEKDTRRPIPGAEEHRFTIAGDGSATLRGIVSGGVTWSFQAIPDKPPVIALTKEPERQARGSLRLLYKLEDDYGVTGAQATFAPKQKTAGAKALAPRPLFGPPEMPLSLPQARTRNGAGQTIKDLTEHPWAGTEVTMTLTARDDGGNEGRSEPQDLRLPERVFVKPLARALVEQRRNLALDAEAQADVLLALEAMTIAPERFEMEAGVYLGLRSIYWQLGRSTKDDELREVVARLWSIAIGIEDGNLSDVEKALRAAQDALREALERGATEEELKKLMDQLRAALDRYLQALAEQMRRSPDQMARPLDQNTRMLRPQDLRSMLDQMENLARSGNRDAARRMLDQLAQMLENLRMARPGGEMDGDDDMMSALDQLGDMIRRQQQLRDRTFREGQDQRGERRRGQQRGDRNQNQFGDLQRDQKALRDQLRQLMEQLKQFGMGQRPGQRPGQQGEKGDGMGELGRAGEEMGNAEGQLGEGDGEGAVGSQGRALEALRRGAQGMAQAMQQGQGQGPGPGQPGRFGRSRANQDTDPLGRPLRGRDYGDDSTVKVPGEIDVQRARRILEELRRRFGETFRPQLELDYIERLLKDF